MTTFFRRMALSASTRRQIALAALWAAGTAACLMLWDHFRAPGAWENAPELARRILRLLGPTVYSDADLAARVRISRAALLGTALCLAAWGWLTRAYVRRRVLALWNLSTHPLNLAVLRIVVFTQIYAVCWFDQIPVIASLPDGLQYPPETGIPGIGPLRALAAWPLHPLGPDEVHAALTALAVVSVTGAIGLFSRLSAGLAAALLLVGWGAVQFYGKVGHHHHLFWFAALLALAPSGDALSVDALVRAWRRGRSGRTAPPGPSRRYGAPIAAVMLLMGVAYFFPGVWKFSRSGFDWAFSDSPRYTMYQKWRMSGAEALTVIDRFDPLLRAGALATIVFELSFVFLIFGRVTRYLAAAAGFTFHNLNQALMNMGFESLERCYVVFVDWDGLLRWAGGRIFPEPMTFTIGGGSRAQLGFVGVARAFDWFGRVDWREGGEGLSCRVRNTTLTGGEALAAAARRVPLLLPAAALLQRLPNGDAGPVAGEPFPGRRASTVLPAAAAILLASNVWMGARRQMNGWPAACYPLFDGLTGDSSRTLRIVATTADGAEREIEADRYRSIYSNDWNNLLARILDGSDPREKRRRLEYVWQVILRHEPALAEAARVRFLSATTRLTSAESDLRPAEPELLFELERPQGGPQR